MRFLILSIICFGAVISLGHGAEEQGKAPKVEAVEKKEGLEQLRRELEKLFVQRKYQEAVALCDAHLSQDNLDADQQQAGLSMRYFSLMGLRDFAKASETAKALREVDPKTPLGKQAVSLKKRADAALAAADRPKQVKPVRSKKEAGQVKKSADLEKPKAVSGHQKALRALDASHQGLVVAEKALVKAEMDLAKARAAHEKAHKAEAVAREVLERKAAQELKKKELSKKPKTEPEAKKEESSEKKEEVIFPIDEFEKRASDLLKRAAELRKKGEELRKETEE